MIKPILMGDNLMLRQVSEPVTKLDDVVELVKDMLDTLRASEAGIGLSAIQIGVPLRVIIAEYMDAEMGKLRTQVLINPSITRREGYWLAQEGCLSFPGLVIDVPRQKRIMVKAHGQHFRTRGLLAHLIQHEVDHLNGVLFTDLVKSA